MPGRLRGPRLLALLATLAILQLVAFAAPTRAAQAVLYDGSAAGQTLGDQGFIYVTLPQPPVAATASYAAGGTTLTTTGSQADYAGFSIRATSQVPLARATGFTLRFTLQLLAEAHSEEHRAGLSVIMLADDRRGIELGLWDDEIWAQNDGPALFTHGEGATFDTTQQIDYALTIHGERYSLAADGVQILEGPLRDYTASIFPTYSVPNYIWLGDNTSAAGAEVRIFAVSIETDVFPNVTATPTTTATATPTTTATAPAFVPVTLYLPLITR